MSKKIPMRTCIGCGQVKEKRELIRMVLTEDGRIRIDPMAREPGRGAYVCPDPECAAKARKRRALVRAFHTGVADEEYKRLADLLENRKEGRKS